VIKTTPATLALDAARRAIGELRDAAGTLSRSLTHLALALDDGDRDSEARYRQHMAVALTRYEQAREQADRAVDCAWTALNQELEEAQPCT